MIKAEGHKLLVFLMIYKFGLYSRLIDSIPVSTVKYCNLKKSVSLKINSKNQIITNSLYTSTKTTISIE